MLVTNRPQYVRMQSAETDEGIFGFFGDYRFLSNFHVCRVEIDGLVFSSSEAAYMSRKTDDLSIKESFTRLDPKEARRLGQQIKLIDDWENKRVQAMFDSVYSKFSLNEDIRIKLLATGEKYLEETNHWGDRYWGFCDGEGLNRLGNVLMNVRSLMRDQYGRA